MEHKSLENTNQQQFNCRMLVALSSSSVAELSWFDHFGRLSHPISNHFLGYPLVSIQKAIENGPVEIVDIPKLIAWWIFP